MIKNKIFVCAHTFLFSIFYILLPFHFFLTKMKPSSKHGIIQNILQKSFIFILFLYPKLKQGVSIGVFLLWYWDIFLRNILFHNFGIKGDDFVPQATKPVQVTLPFRTGFYTGLFRVISAISRRFGHSGRNHLRTGITSLKLIVACKNPQIHDTETTTKFRRSLPLHHGLVLLICISHSYLFFCLLLFFAHEHQRPGFSVLSIWLLSALCVGFIYSF